MMDAPSPLSLQALLARAVTAQAAKEENSKTRSKLKDTRLSEEERNDLLRKLRQWESENDYTKTALVFRVPRYTCENCGSIHEGSGQVMMREDHKRVASTHKLIAIPAPYPKDLPREWLWDDVKVTICQACAFEEGFEK